ETLALAATAYADPSPGVRGLALEVLAQAVGRAPIESLTRYSADPDRQVRSRALQVLIGSRRPDCIDIIIERTELESDDELSDVAQDGVGQLLSSLYAAEDGGATYSIPEWIDRRMEGATGGRVHAVQVAGRMGLMTSELLDRALSDPAPAVRTAAIGSLRTVNADAAALLITTISRDTSADVSLAAVRTLGSAPIGDQMHGARLALGHPDRRVRLAGIELLPVEEGGAEALQALLGDDDRLVAEAA